MLIFIYCYDVCSHLNKLPELLESSDVEMRIAAGDTIALLYELMRQHDEVHSTTYI